MNDLIIKFVIGRKRDGLIRYVYKTLDEIIKDNFVCNDAWEIIRYSVTNIYLK